MNERARKVLSFAQEEAQRFQHNYIGTEHLLLGLVREGEGVAANVLSNLGVDEARRLNHHYIGTEHLLLGLVREGEGIAAGVLESLGVNLEKVLNETIKVLNQKNP